MTDSKPDYEYDLDPDADNNTASSVYRMAAEGGKRVLDLGSGPGIVASALVEHESKIVTCLDVDPDYLQAARDRGVPRTVQADLADERWIEQLGGEQYDVIILADVLEHLVDPGSVLDAIRDNGLLSASGYLVVSIPNVAHEAVIATLAGGRFDYTETGLLDATHLRFFTNETFQLMCERHGFVVTRLERTLRTIEQTELFHTVENLRRELRQQMAERSLDARTYQYVMRLEPADVAHELARLRGEAEEQKRRRIREVEEARRRFRLEREEAESRLTAEKEELESRLAVAREELDETRARSERERDERDQLIAKMSRDLAAERRDKEREIAAAKEELQRLRSSLDDQRAALDDHRAELDDLRRRYEEQFDARQRHRQEAQRLRRKIEDVYASETWRVGRAIMWLPRRLKVAARSASSSADEDDDTGRVRSRRRVPARLHPSYELTEANELRAEYQAAIDRRRFRYRGRTHVAVTVSTVDLDEGRGDLYTAVGLGRHLEMAGYECLYLPPERWYEVPEGTDLYLSLLAEPRFVLDPTRIPPSCLLVGWIRNNTHRWIRSGSLPLYDGVFCSSERTRSAIERAYDGPTTILRIGVDRELFAGDPDGGRTGVVATVNQWGELRDTYRTLSEIDIDFPLTIHGVQRDLPSGLQPFARGPVSYFQIPSLYGAAAIVLDDQQGVNRPYGNVNSRVFEALAAGALAISATPNGLSEVGLDQVPTYGSPDELRSLVRRYLGDPDERSSVVAELQTHVLEEHTFERRARRFDDFVSGLGDRRHGAEKTLVAFQPDYTVTNPYQDLLYARLHEANAVAVPIEAGELPERLRPRPARRFFHVHWTATILGPAGTRRDAERLQAQFSSQIDRLRRDGTRIVWTIHNVLPHECAFPEVEIALRRSLAERADIIHVMCEGTLGAVAGLYPLPQERVHVIGHGSYIDVYPNIVSEERARSDLGLRTEDRVLLFFGQIRPYKGLDRLLDAFEAVRSEQPNLRLLVAGAPGRFEGVQDLVARCRAMEGVMAHLQEVPDAELQRYFNASDVVVLPHRKVLNSGGVLLAFSFGRPVVAPRSGCVQDLVDGELGRLFDPDGSDLERVLANVEEICTPAHRAAAFAVASSYPYTAMASAFSRLLEVAD